MERTGHRPQKTARGILANVGLPIRLSANKKQAQQLLPLCLPKIVRILITKCNMKRIYYSLLTTGITMGLRFVALKR